MFLQTKKKKKKSFFPMSGAHPASFDPVPRVAGGEKLKAVGRQCVSTATRKAARRASPAPVLLHR